MVSFRLQWQTNLCMHNQFHWTARPVSMNTDCDCRTHKVETSAWRGGLMAMVMGGCRSTRHVDGMSTDITAVSDLQFALAGRHRKAIFVSGIAGLAVSAAGGWEQFRNVTGSGGRAT